MLIYKIPFTSTNHSFILSEFSSLISSLDLFRDEVCLFTPDVSDDPLDIVEEIVSGGFHLLVFPNKLLSVFTLALSNNSAQLLNKLPTFKKFRIDCGSIEAIAKARDIV